MDPIKYKINLISISKYEIVDKSQKCKWYKKEFFSMANLETRVVLVFTQVSDLYLKCEKNLKTQFAPKINNSLLLSSQQKPKSNFNSLPDAKNIWNF